MRNRKVCDILDKEKVLGDKRVRKIGWTEHIFYMEKEKCPDQGRAEWMCLYNERMQQTGKSDKRGKKWIPKLK